MDPVESNEQLNALQVSLQFFRGKEKCPFCTQIPHLQHLIPSMKITHTHDPFMCINNWVALIVVSNREGVDKSPEKLQEHTDKLVFRIIEDVKNASRGLSN